MKIKTLYSNNKNNIIIKINYNKITLLLFKYIYFKSLFDTILNLQTKYDLIIY